MIENTFRVLSDNLLHQYCSKIDSSNVAYCGFPSVRSTMIVDIRDPTDGVPRTSQ
jgi:hypothetical protein